MFVKNNRCVSKGLNGLFTDISFVLVYRLFLIYVTFFVLRIIFFAANKSLFPEVTVMELIQYAGSALLFDTSAIIYLNLLYILFFAFPNPLVFKRWYAQFLKWLFLTLNGIGIVANIGDIFYFPFTLKRTTAMVFGQFKDESNMVGLVSRFLVDFWPGTLLFVLIMIGLYILYDQLEVKRGSMKPLGFYSYRLVSLAVMLGLCIAGMRGGFLHSIRPITVSNATQYVKSPEEAPIVLNTPFCIIRTIDKKGLEPKKYYNSEAELQRVFNPVHQPDSTVQPKKLNVVIIILESWSREFVGVLNRNVCGQEIKGYTPFMDSLLQQSYTFKYAFANGRKSIDAMPSILASVPSMDEPYVLTPYSTNKIDGLGSILSRHGYNTAFYHGAQNSSMGFQAFSKVAGISNYFGRDNYANDNDYDGIWGIWDEPFLQYLAQNLNKTPEPFFASEFTLSSHHPFKVPQKFVGKFPKGPLPVQECIGYTDYALRRFFETAKTMPWYKNTLFVISADHSTVAHSEFYKNSVGAFSIPIAFYRPGGELAKFDTTSVAQQIDIMPSILSYLGINEPFFGFGKNLFDRQSPQFAMNHTAGGYQIFLDNYVVNFDGQKITSLYDYRSDGLLSHNLVAQQPRVVAHIDSFARAFVQQYNNRLIENRTVAGK